MRFVFSFLFLSLVTNLSAAISFTIEQIGPDILVTSSGQVHNPFKDGSTIPDGTAINSAVDAEITPSLGIVSFGADPSGASVYAGGIASGPTGANAFGSNAGVFSGSGTGPVFGFDTITGDVFVDADELFSQTDWSGMGGTFAGITFSDVGITPGTYVWTLDSRFNNDTITINAIPEPSTYAIFVGALAITLAVSRRRFRKTV